MNFSSLLLGIILLSIGTFGQTTNYCDDAYECEDDTLTYTSVYCYGFYGCDSADITASYVYGYGSLSAYYSDTTSTYIYAYGDRTFYYADLATQYLLAYGYQVAYYADITPRYSYLYVYFYGYFSGYGADILCYSGDYCYLYCGDSTGCYATRLYCYSGSSCYYHCSDAVYCPTHYSSEDMTDEEIKAKYDENKQIKETMKASDDPLNDNDDIVDHEGETDEAKKARILAVNHMMKNSQTSFNKYKDNIIYGVVFSGLFAAGILYGKYGGSNKEYEQI